MHPLAPCVSQSGEDRRRIGPYRTGRLVTVRRRGGAIAGCTETHTWTVAEQENAAGIVAGNRDRQRHPQRAQDEVHRAREDEDDSRVGGDGSPTVTRRWQKAPPDK